MMHSIAHSIHVVQTFKACPDLEPFSRQVTVFAQHWLTTDVVVCKAAFHGMGVQSAISRATISVDHHVTRTYLAHHELERVVIIIAFSYCYYYYYYHQ